MKPITKREAEEIAYRVFAAILIVANDLSNRDVVLSRSIYGFSTSVFVEFSTEVSPSGLFCWIPIPDGFKLIRGDFEADEQGVFAYCLEYQKL